MNYKMILSWNRAMHDFMPSCVHAERQGSWMLVAELRIDDVRNERESMPKILNAESQVRRTNTV